MRQDVSGTSGTAALFRQKAIEAASQRAFGTVTAVLPPSAVVALASGLLAVSLLGFAAWYVEVAERVHAAGVLMPPDGLLDIVAGTPGRIARMHVAEGQTFEAGEPLFEIVSDLEALARFRLQSLEAQEMLLDEARALEAAIDRSRARTLDEQLESLERRLAVAKSEYDIQARQVDLLERRFARRQDLAAKGGVSLDALDGEQGVLLQATSRLAALRRSLLDYEQQIAAASRRRGQAADESGRRDILHAVERRRLDRQIAEQRQLVRRDIRATEAGLVARINVQPGAMVAAGETLLKVYRPYASLEAWLYLSSNQAGLLEPGRSIELQIDAYPYETFGTVGASVRSVSRVAIVPRDVKVPLALPGAAFEIRAAIDDGDSDVFAARGKPAPGTSFQADLVMRRVRLYEWLLRHVVQDRRGRRARP